MTRHSPPNESEKETGSALPEVGMGKGWPKTSSSSMTGTLDGSFHAVLIPS